LPYYTVPEGQTPRTLTEVDYRSILIRGAPSFWKREMMKAGFQAHTASVEELLNYFDNLQSIQKPPPSPNESGDSKLGQSRRSGRKPRAKTQHVAFDKEKKFCEFCEMNNHITKDCWKMQRAKHSFHGSEKKSTSAGKRKRYTEEQAHAMEQRLNRLEKKYARTRKVNEESSSDDEDEESKHIDAKFTKYLRPTFLSVYKEIVPRLLGRSIRSVSQSRKF
ncbi:MAG: hypothetical protein ACREBR_01745, partial [bacterium]